jgi:hypothetical protein
MNATWLRPNLIRKTSALLVLWIAFVLTGIPEILIQRHARLFAFAAQDKIPEAPPYNSDHQKIIDLKNELTTQSVEFLRRIKYPNTIGTKNGIKTQKDKEAFIQGELRIFETRTLELKSALERLYAVSSLEIKTHPEKRGLTPEQALKQSLDVMLQRDVATSAYFELIKQIIGLRSGLGLNVPDQDWLSKASLTIPIETAMEYLKFAQNGYTLPPGSFFGGFKDGSHSSGYALTPVWPEKLTIELSRQMIEMSAIRSRSMKFTPEEADGILLSILQFGTVRSLYDSFLWTARYTDGGITSNQVPAVPEELTKKLSFLGTSNVREWFERQVRESSETPVRQSIIKNLADLYAVENNENALIRDKFDTRLSLASLSASNWPMFMTADLANLISEIIFPRVIYVKSPTDGADSDKMSEADYVELKKQLFEELKRLELRDTAYEFTQLIIPIPVALTALTKKQRDEVLVPSLVTASQKILLKFVNQLKIDGTEISDEQFDAVRKLSNARREEFEKEITNAAQSFFADAITEGQTRVHSDTQENFDKALIEASKMIADDETRPIGDMTFDVSILANTLSSALSPGTNLNFIDILFQGEGDQKTHYVPEIKKRSKAVTEWVEQFGAVSGYAAARDYYNAIIEQLLNNHNIVKNGQLDFAQARDLINKTDLDSPVDSAIKNLESEFGGLKRNDIKKILTIGEWFGFDRALGDEPKVKDLALDDAKVAAYTETLRHTILDQFHVLDYKKDGKTPLYKILAANGLKADKAHGEIQLALKNKVSVIESEIKKVSQATKIDDVIDVAAKSHGLQAFLGEFPELGPRWGELVKKRYTPTTVDSVSAGFSGANDKLFYA